MHLNSKTLFSGKNQAQKAFLHYGVFIAVIFLLLSCSSKKKDHKKIVVDESNRLLLDSMISSYMIIPWNETISKTIVLKQKETLDTLEIENSVLIEGSFHGRKAYVFKNGPDCLGSFVTDSSGTLQFFNSSLFCLDSAVVNREL